MFQTLKSKVTPEPCMTEVNFLITYCTVECLDSHTIRELFAEREKKKKHREMMAQLRSGNKQPDLT